MILDASSNLKKHVVNNPDFEEKRAIFSLDSHVNSGMKEMAKFRCPMIAELEAINCLKRRGPKLMTCKLLKKKIHEMKIVTLTFIMKCCLKKLNANYKLDFILILGHQENDVLLAYL